MKAKITIIWLILTGFIFGGEQSIETKLSLEQSEFLMASPITVTYIMTNKSSTSVSLNCSDIIERIFVFDETGKGYHPNEIGSYIGYPDTLRPGESCSGIFELNIFSQLREVKGQSIALKDLGFLPPGKYSVWAKGKIPVRFLSNTVTVTIKEPEGVDKEAFESFMQAKTLMYERDTNNKPKFAAYYSALISTGEKYSKSIYGECALNRALTIYREVHTNDLRGEIEFAKKLIVKYRNSSYLSRWFGYVFRGYRELKDRTTLIRTLEEYRDTYPNTKISQIAEKNLKSLEEMEF